MPVRGKLKDSGVSPISSGGSLAGDIDRAGGFAVQEGIGKLDNVRLGDGEDGSEREEEVVVGRVVGPEGEDAAFFQMRGEGAQAGGGVEDAVARVEEIARGGMGVRSTAASRGEPMEATPCTRSSLRRS